MSTSHRAAIGAPNPHRRARRGRLVLSLGPAPRRNPTASVGRRRRPPNGRACVRGWTLGLPPAGRPPAPRAVRLSCSNGSPIVAAGFPRAAWRPASRLVDPPEPRRDEPDASPRRRSCRTSFAVAFEHRLAAPRAGQGVRRPAGGAGAVRGPRSASGFTGARASRRRADAKPGSQPAALSAASTAALRPMPNGISRRADAPPRGPPRGPPTARGRRNEDHRPRDLTSAVPPRPRHRVRPLSPPSAAASPL